jgi:hypothetical protein
MLRSPSAVLSNSRSAGRMCVAGSMSSPRPVRRRLPPKPRARIGEFYGIEAGIRGRSAQERRAIRQAKSRRHPNGRICRGPIPATYTSNTGLGQRLK